MSIDCGRFQGMVDDLALGLLTGGDRAAALAHLDECYSCRAEVAALTETADEILLLAPSVPADAGFERRVLARLEQERIADVTSLRMPWWRRARVVVAVAAALVAALLVVPMVLRSDQSARPSVTAVMRTSAGQIVGDVRLRAGDRTTVVMHIPGWGDLARQYGEPADGRYSLSLERDDGSRELIPLPANRAGAWKVNVGAALPHVARTAIVDRQGRVWCSATFA